MHKRRSVGLDDYILFIAFVISIVLVAQTTWAVLDEGQGVPESELLNHPHGSFTMVSKVSSSHISSIPLYLIHKI
jgi:hypothetical protein